MEPRYLHCRQKQRWGTLLDTQFKNNGKVKGWGEEISNEKEELYEKLKFKFFEEHRRTMLKCFKDLKIFVKGKGKVFCNIYRQRVKFFLV